MVAFDGANRQLNGHADREFLDFGFVNFSDKNEVLHVRYCRDGRALIEIVGLDDAVALLDRNIEHHAVNG